MEITNIPEVEKCYQDEWLLFEVTETDELNRPIKGRLLAHNPSRAAVYDIMGRNRSKYAYVTYTGPKPRKGMVSVL